jgi:hypothetical protein
MPSFSGTAVDPSFFDPPGDATALAVDDAWIYWAVAARTASGVRASVVLLPFRSLMA